MKNYRNAIFVSFCVYSGIYLGMSAFMFHSQIALLFVGMSVVTGIFAKKVADFIDK